MEENSDTVLIAVDTNVDTNLVVIAPRSATIADILEKIKRGHMALYPSDGSITILAVKVEMFNRHYLIEESHKVGEIFRGWQGSLHVEVTGYRPNLPTASKLGVPLITAGNKAQVSTCKICEHPLPGVEEQVDRRGNSPDNGPTPSLVQPEISLRGRSSLETSPNRAVASQAVEVVGSQRSSDGRNSSERMFLAGSQDVVFHRPTRAEGQGNETVEAGLDMALDAILDAGAEKPGNVGRNRDRPAYSDGHIVASKDTFGTLAFAQSTSGKSARSKAQFSGDSGLSGHRKRRPGDLDLTGPKGLLADSTVFEDIQKQSGESAPKKNKIKSKPGANPVKIGLIPAKANQDTGEKIVGGTKVNVAAPMDISSSESGPNNLVGEKAEGSSRERAKVELLSGAKTSDVRVTDGITHGKTAEKGLIDARKAGKPHPMLRFGGVRSHSPGSSTSDSSEKSQVKEPVKLLDVNAPVMKRSEVQNESSDGSSISGDSSKSYQPDGGPGTRDVDAVVKDLVSLYSPIISDDSGSEQSSDASEELQPKGLRRRMNSRASDEADNTAERKGRRGSRTTSGLDKFQHFIDSQDGLDQLLGLTLSQRKSKLSSAVEPEPQVPAIQRAALAFDGLSIDVVPDTQVGNGNIDASAQREVYTEEIMHVEKTTGEGLKDPAVDLVQGGNPDIRPTDKDERKASKTKSKRASLSADANEDPSEALKNFASIATESPRKLDSNEDFLQPKSDDSQQFQAAVQLTRLSMADDEDGADSDPMRSPVDRSVEKKKKKKMKPDTPVALSPQNDLPDKVENSTKTDRSRRGLATPPSDLKDDSALPPKDNPPREVDVDRTGTDLASPGNRLGVGEQSSKYRLERNDAEVKAVIEAVPGSAKTSEEENVELESERARLTEAAPVVEDSEGQERDQDRSDFATPGNALEKKKPSVRRRKEETARAKETEPNIREAVGGRSAEPAVTTKKTENVLYVEDSPVKDRRGGGEGQNEPSTLGESRSQEKSGRKKVKKGIRPADTPANENREDSSSHSVLRENGEGIDRGSDKSVSERVEDVQVVADVGLDVKEEAGAMIIPGKRKKKKPKADNENHLFGSEFANANESRREGMQMKTSSIVSSRPSSADGGLTYEAPTSGPRTETFALTEGNSQLSADQGTLMTRLVSKKKKKAKKASSLEPTAGVTDAEVEIGRTELHRATSDVGAVIPISELGHAKPPRPQKKKSSKHMELLSSSAEKASLLTAEEMEPVQSQHPERYTVETHSKELKRRTFSDDFADFDSKDGILTSKPAVIMNEEPFKTVESMKRRRKNPTPGGIGGNIPFVMLDANSSPSREDRLGMDDDKKFASAFDSTREGGTTVTPRKKKKKTSGILLIGEAENDEALEPSCNQLGYRSGSLSELNRDVGRNSTLVDNVFMDDRTTEGQTKARKKRVKNMMSDVEKTVRASSPIREHPGSRTPKPKKRKQLTDPEPNGVTVIH